MCCVGVCGGWKQTQMLLSGMLFTSFKTGMLTGLEFNNYGEYLVSEGQIPCCLSSDVIVSMQACSTLLTVKYEFWELNLGSHVTFVTEPSSGSLA